MKYLETGTLAHGKIEEIVPELFRILKELSPETADEFLENYEIQEGGNTLDSILREGNETCLELFYDLSNCLGEFALPYHVVVFQNQMAEHILDWDWLEDNVPKIPAGDEFPENETEVLTVTDHGNIEFFAKQEDGNWKSVWSYV